MFKQQDGDQLNYTTTGAVTNGQLILVGDSVGVARTAATGSGAKISLGLVGVYSGLAKKAAASTNFAVGERVYYMTTGGVVKATAVAAAGQFLGIGWAAAATGDTTCTVRLAGGAGPLETTT